MIKKIIIGKNSIIVNKIKKTLIDIDFISHKEISSTNLKNYDYIYLFSWSHKSYMDNKKILDKLPKKKIIFISTVSVLSNYKRHQWNEYPVNKKKIEELVLNEKGIVVRLGVFKDKLQNHNYPIIPYTSYEQLSNFINKTDYMPKKVYDCFDLYETKKNLKFLEKIFYFLSLLFSKIKILRIGFEFISKYAIKSFYYGYTADTLSFFAENLQIGYGAIGSFHKRYFRNRLIITSNQKNKIITKNGFNNTYIGYDKIGLSKFWHGVYLEKNKNNYFKRVPFFVKRKRVPFTSINAHVESVKLERNIFSLTCKSKYSKIRVYGLRIIFAAGIIENIKLLNILGEVKKDILILNDHEWINLGYVNFDEVLKKGLLKKKLFLIFREKLLRELNHAFDVLIEFRPFSTVQLKSKSFELYSDTKINIFLKLVKNFNIFRINEAFFNKFGFAFKTNKIILTALINNKNCIKLSSNKLKKTRISKEKISKIRNEMGNKFTTFAPFKNNKTYDSQHMNGGEEILENKIIKELIKSKKIHIVGFPSKLENDDFYPTKKFILREKNFYE